MNKTLIAAAIGLSLGLAGCGSSGGGSTGGSSSYPGHGDSATLVTLDREPVSFSIQAASSAVTDSTLPCNQGSSATDVCDLRIYQVMVESFIDGDANHDYNFAYGNSQHKGDLQGIIDAIPYIASTGSNALWLTPIFHSIAESGQDHWADRLDGTGYFTSDYFAIDPKFGTEAQFRELVDTAHAAGIRIFLDGVFGHHKGNVVPSPNGLLPTGDANPVDYPGVDNATIDFYKEVATYWINEYQIDGWRLDQAYQVPLEYWQEIREAVESASADPDNSYQLDSASTQPLGYMVAEIWKGESDIASEAYGEEANPALLSAFDFPMRYRLVQTLAGEESGRSNRPASNLASGFLTHNAYPSHATPNLMLTNHDLVRFGDLLQRSGLANPEDDDYWKRHQAAFAFMTAYSGPITLYYGDEIGDEVADYFDQVDCANDGGQGATAGYCDDHVARSPAKIEGLPTVLGDAPFAANEPQAALRDFVAQAFSLREQQPALARGSRTHIFSNDYLYIDRKDTDSNHVLFVLNAKPNPLSFSIEGEAIGSSGELVSLLDNQRFAPSGGLYDFELAPFEALFLEIATVTEAGPTGGVSDDDSGDSDGGDLDSEMARCDLSPASGGSLNETLYLRGSWSDSNWDPVSARQFQHMGDNIYQVIIDENAGSFSFQIANDDWSTQRTINNVLPLNDKQNLIQGGYQLDTEVSLSQAGRYVYAIRASNGVAQSLQVSLCE